ncbi:LysR family transcriptional regulator [Ramlibacter rhizophilus]|uniref:LysR family transcriptional regulator n=1 Tax=Ramlibacter rhizophilus TaxID=1781167 RepID=A0A4Z0BZ53_9BURK|nr:LysR substrate-binding domain-containing protein [Ramlibacter rhizophilus]TFZ04503.1 LysR family transcriptional regulator [Ramlibacter rhizophilus]
MNLRQMEVFRAVMLTGGVGGAAELLHVSQPAISKVLAQAQRQLGFALFSRIKGRLVPTPEAQALRTEIEALWRGVERVRDVSRSLASPRSGTLSVAVSASLAAYLVPRTLALLAERYPGLQSRMEILIAPIMVDALLDHSAEVGVALLPNEHPNLVQVRSYQCGFSCVVPPEHPLAARRSVSPRDLLGERVIGSPPDTPYGQALQRAYGKAAAALQVHFHVRSATSACWQAQAGGGIAVVDRAAVAGPTFQQLAIRPFRTRERLPVAVVRNRYRPPSQLQEAFCETFDTVWKQAMRD